MSSTSGVAFRSAATVSITYALMSRCGLEPESYFDHEDFLSIFDFNTPAVVNALGTAVSQSSQQVLRQIGAAIKHYEYERSQTNERTDLYPERGLFVPNPDLEEPEVTKPLGKYGRMRKDYLKAHRTVLYNSLLLSGKLTAHLQEIDEAANCRLELMVPELAKTAGVTENLKASDPMKWVGLMNNCKAQAEEMILTDLIYN